ncbi:hypothetical protein MMC12_003678 [Toensbergia leucococca]|nr:hypothetical protein [Toensbergia leucococca]
MEVFCRNLPVSITETQVKTLFRPYLAKLAIYTYHCRKLKGKGCAILVILDVEKGEKFLVNHGQTKPGAEGFRQVRQKIHHQRRPINCSRSTNLPDPYLLQSLQEEERGRLSAARSFKSKPATVQLKASQRRFDAVGLLCGRWAYVGDDLVFSSQYEESQFRSGEMIFGSRSMTFILDPVNNRLPRHRIDISYSCIESTTTGNLTAPSVTLSLSEAPKMFEILNTPEAEDDPLAAAMRGLNIKTASTPKPQMTLLNSALSKGRYDRLSFGLKFQLQRLAQNGYLPPTSVVELLDLVANLAKLSTDATMVDSVRRLFNQIPYPGPDTEASELSFKSLSNYLRQNQGSISQERSYSSGLAETYDHLCFVHRATVTPAGTYLDGPDLEVKNRVLRKYSDFSNHFLQVSFLDEDGESVRFDRNASLHEIYHVRFKKVLEGVINIAGRGYEFLGFSHSSLRSQTCWFMAPFVLNEELLYAKLVIAKLGNFSHIRSPAKCAARIGQAFSQTFSSISLPPEAFSVLKDVERNGRVFSDGCGTCSLSVLQRIHYEYAQSRTTKPTLFQIRFAGAKGMISLDSRLQGDALCLRESMIKFEGTGVTDIEICGASSRPLSMYLNRQLIKILEDLGVPVDPFLELQANAVDQLRSITLSPINAASFLQRNGIGKSARVSWLIRKLYYLGLQFNQDDFLRNILEAAVLIQLRELKYRSRILVEKGVTLYGIMDETNYLEEGQIYCCFDGEEGISILQGRVVITRCPALHPGDVQLVDAVNIPSDSPLGALQNCVVFSSQGQRDLPSMLSGGDLDGDLYNIIFDENLYPKRISEPADYPIVDPIDIHRIVNRSDMTDFFVLFMENDQLGRIATMHQTLADLKKDGTFDPDCIMLAGLHSSAVDFSKTGIPADIKQIPRQPSNIRPDFQAPGPRLLIEEDIKLVEEDLDRSEARNEIDDILDNDQSQMRYYKSQKALGKLYRAIDEKEFCEQIKTQSLSSGNRRSIIDTVWKWVQEQTTLIQWKHLTDLAMDIKEAYEENLVETMLRYSTHPPHYLSEVEVCAGSILGKNGAQSHRQREFSVGMKEQYERDVAYTVACITQGEDGAGTNQALERSIACLAVGCTRVRVRKKVGELVSFAWVAAAVCLKEVERLRGS